MTEPSSAGHSPAWYVGARGQFLATAPERIRDQLAGRAAQENLEVESAQGEEWLRSLGQLQQHLDDRIAIVRRALSHADCAAITHVILEFDFRRRGLRMDCLLLAAGALFVVEFKRSTLTRADRDQVMNYAVNLLEFHKVTQGWCTRDAAIVVPVLALTAGKGPKLSDTLTLGGHSWPDLAHRAVECDGETLGAALALGLKARRSEAAIDCEAWLASPFRPSSSILDATLSLYGQHDVAAIEAHAAPKAAIDASVAEIREHIDDARAHGRHHIVFLSGAPGAGKTLVGLDLVMRGPQAREAVFVTGNAPLVDVLNTALVAAYRRQGSGAKTWTHTGYRQKDAKLVTAAASFKVVKAHNFLGPRGHAHHQEDARVVVFDEAQRTYEKGRQVLGKPLADHEADLILQVQRAAYPEGGTVVVALVGHNQAINRGERGIVAWLEAADRLRWSFSIADETLALAELGADHEWAAHPGRRRLANGHLQQSMRFYRNAEVESWVGALLDDRTAEATACAARLKANGCPILLTRSLAAARRWARPQTLGGQRAGIIASGQARRLAAEGLFVDYKPDIATWMLAPSSDIRASNALETVQNQYQVQGLELDFTIVAWDADLRREKGRWAAYKLSGGDWQRDKLTDVAKNGYRVLLTRARQGMVIFVPRGDETGEDETRQAAFYDEIAAYLMTCGAELLPVT
jgi:hypothetical protein